MTLDYVTVAGNSARKSSGGFTGTGSSLGGGIFSTNSATTVHATLFANSPSGSNCFAAFVDNGFNLNSDSSFTFTNTGSLNSVDPKLGPFDNYGGPTPTMVLLTGSPAIDGGGNAACLATDQRGHSRPYGSACDIGALESSVPFLIRGRISGNTLQDEVAITFGSGSSNTLGHAYASKVSRQRSTTSLPRIPITSSSRPTDR